MRTWLLPLALAACGEAAPPADPPVAPDVAAQLRIPSTSSVEGVELAPDGAYVATLGLAGYHEPTPCTVWRTATGTAQLTVPAGLVRLGATASGAPRLVSVRQPSSHDGYRVEVYDADTGQALWHDSINLEVVDLAIDRRGVLLTLGSDHSVTRWDLATGARIEVLSLDRTGAHHLAVASDGRTLLAGRLLYDVAGHAPIAMLDIAENPTGSVELTPDGQRVVVANEAGEVAVLDRHGAVVRTLAHAGQRVQPLADGTLLGFDPPQVTRWDLATGARVAAFDLPDGAQLVHHSWLPLGAGGHAVVQRGDQLAVLQLAPAGPVPAPIEIGRIGLPAQPLGLRWSGDGQTLAIRVDGLRRDRIDDELAWSVTGALSTRLAPASGDAPGDAPSERTVQIAGPRGFIRAPDGHVARMVAAPEDLEGRAALGPRWLAASDKSGAIYLWNPDTGEGLGALPAGERVVALALRPDDRTLAVARQTGAIELWDLPSRSRVLDLAVWHGGWIARAPGDPSAPPAFALAHPPAPRPIAPTPPTTLPIAPACVPKRPSNDPLYLSVTERAITYCIGTRDEIPYCYAAALGPRPPRALAPVSPPLDALVLPPNRLEPSYTTEPHGAELDVCDPEHRCKSLPIWLRHRPDTESENDGMAIDDAAVSDDGALLAIRRHATSVVETWDVTAGTMIARFPVQFPGVHEEAGIEPHEIGFLGHTVLVSSTPCAGPCGEGVLYDVHGKWLAPLFAESSSSNPQRFHDDLWVFDTLESRFDVQDLATGRHLLTGALEEGTISVGPAVFAVARGKDHLGTLEVYDRAARKIATLHVPMCATRT